MRRLAIASALTAGTLLVGTVGAAVALQPSSNDEAWCYWTQRQMDGHASIVDKVACKVGAKKEAEAERQRQEREARIAAEREQAAAAKRRADEERERAERQADEQRQMAARQAEIRETACIKAASDNLDQQEKPLSAEWHALNSEGSSQPYPSDQRIHEIDARMGEIERQLAEIGRASSQRTADCQRSSASS